MSNKQLWLAALAGLFVGVVLGVIGYSVLGGPSPIRLEPVSIGGNVWKWAAGDDPCNRPDPSTATGVWYKEVVVRAKADVDGDGDIQCPDEDPNSTDDCRKDETNNVGGYSFSYLYPLQYEVTVEEPAGATWHCDYDAVASTVDNNSSVDPSPDSVIVDVVVPAPGTPWVNYQVDFGYEP